jgi:hypothetical protein
MIDVDNELRGGDAVGLEVVRRLRGVALPSIDGPLADVVVLCGVCVLS